MNEALNKAAQEAVCEELHTGFEEADLQPTPEGALPAAWGDMLNLARAELPARAENVAVARAFVAALVAARPEANWDITVSTLEEIRVAVSEAVSNAIIHGYAEDPKRTVKLKAEQYQYALVIEVVDDGIGIADIARAREPDFTTGQEHLGLGFAFMESFMDELEVKSAPGRGTAVTLIKYFPAENLRVQA